MSRGVFAMVYEHKHHDLVQIAKEAIHNGVFPGAVIGTQCGKMREITAVGKVDNHMPTEQNVLYDIASVTKMFGSLVLLKLIERTRLSFNDYVADILPDFSVGTHKKDVQIVHLLTYTINMVLPSLSSLKETPREIIPTVLKADLRQKPGKNYFYNNATAIITACVIKEITGKELPELCGEMFFSPLNMRDTTFFPLEGPNYVCAPTEECLWREKLMRGEVHDESTYAMRSVMQSGVAGLFSTVPDLLIFSQMLQNDGVYCGKRYFTEEHICEMGEFRLPTCKQALSLGWQKDHNGLVLGNVPKRLFFKAGFTGVNVILDTKEKGSVVILTNHVFPKRQHGNNRVVINSFWSTVAETYFT